MAGSKRGAGKPGVIGYETTPGNLVIECTLSGRPLIRATVLGMFCGEDCECELASTDTEGAISQLKTLMATLPPH